VTGTCPMDDESSFTAVKEMWYEVVEHPTARSGGWDLAESWRS